jgi:hypothetical protein
MAGTQKCLAMIALAFLGGCASERETELTKADLIGCYVNSELGLMAVTHDRIEIPQHDLVVENWDLDIAFKTRAPAILARGVAIVRMGDGRYVAQPDPAGRFWSIRRDGGRTMIIVSTEGFGGREQFHQTHCSGERDGTRSEP